MKWWLLRAYEHNDKGTQGVMVFGPERRPKNQRGHERVLYWSEAGAVINWDRRRGDPALLDIVDAARAYKALNNGDEDGFSVTDHVLRLSD